MTMTPVHEQGELGDRVKDGVYPLADLHHSLCVFDRAADDLQVRMLQMERCVSNDRANRMALVEKATHEVAPEKAGCAGHQALAELNHAAFWHA